MKLEPPFEGALLSRALDTFAVHYTPSVHRVLSSDGVDDSPIRSVLLSIPARALES